MRYRLLAVLAAVLVSGSGAVASASTTPHHSTALPAITYHTWSNNDGDYMWYNASASQWEAVMGSATEISSAFNCQNGYCQHKTTGGKCLAWERTGNYVNNETCTSPPKPRQMWYIITGSYSEDQWINLYAADVNYGSCGSLPLLSEGAFSALDIECAPGGSPAPYQLWTGH